MVKTKPSGTGKPAAISSPRLAPFPPATSPSPARSDARDRTYIASWPIVEIVGYGAPIGLRAWEEQEIISRFADLAQAILRAPARSGSVRLVAIDGPGGAGKSVFAERLARHLGNAPVVHTDDFASWDDSIEWWGRLEDEFLRPVELGRWPVRFRAYDWEARRLGEWREIPASDLILLEGVSSSRKAVASRLTVAVWVEAPRDRRLARGLGRDGELMRDQWERWMAEEDAHFAKDRARDRADVIVDGAPSVTHDPDEEFVRLVAR